MKLTTNCYPPGRYKEWEGKTIPFHAVGIHDAKVVLIAKREGVPVATIEIPDQAARELEDSPEWLTEEMTLDAVRAWIHHGGEADDYVIDEKVDGKAGPHAFERCDFCRRTKVRIDVADEQIVTSERQCCQHAELWEELRASDDRGRDYRERADA